MDDTMELIGFIGFRFKFGAREVGVRTAVALYEKKKRKSNFRDFRRQSSTSLRGVTNAKKVG